MTRKTYGPHERRGKNSHVLVSLDGPYNKICPKCSKRFLRGAYTGWIDIDPCDKCGAARAKFQQIASLKSRLYQSCSPTKRCVIRAELLALEGV